MWPKGGRHLESCGSGCYRQQLPCGLERDEDWSEPHGVRPPHSIHIHTTHMHVHVISFM